MTSEVRDQPLRQRNFILAVKEDADEAAEEAAHNLLSEDEPWLVTLAPSPDVDLRWWAIRALAICGTAVCIPTLAAALEDDDPSVRAAVPLAIAHVHQRNVGAALTLIEPLARLLGDEDGFVRQTAADALSLCGDDAVDALAAVLAGDNQAARSRATAALRKIGSMKAAGVLFHYLNDGNYLVRSYAYEALDEMGLLETRLLIL